jgi:hypothetical protein
VTDKVAADQTACSGRGTIGKDGKSVEMAILGSFGLFPAVLVC